MRTTVLATLTLGVLGCASTHSTPFDHPVIFVGSLHSETLYRQSTCEAPPWGKSPGASASLPVPTVARCVSNGCGFSEAQFGVERVVGGTFGGKRGLLRYSVGEWCQPEFADSAGRLLVCLYKVDDEHRFRFEPIYPTEDGDVILLQRIEQIGDVKLASLLRPLPKEVRYTNTSTFSAVELDGPSAPGLGDTYGREVSASKGVFIEDLALRLSRARWEPRKVSTIVPDGLGGYVEIPNDGPAVTPGPEKPGRIEIWDC